MPEALVKRTLDKVAAVVRDKLSSAKLPFESRLSCAYTRGSIIVYVLGLSTRQNVGPPL
ncbi:hypothetical protein [Thermus thalpophilus]